MKEFNTLIFMYAANAFITSQLEYLRLRHAYSLI